MKCTLAIAALVASAAAAPAADHAAPSYAPRPYQPAPYHPAAYKEPSYDEPPKYEYTYAVADDYSKANFQQSEGRDGYATNGEYRVNLPDGRTQIVTYSVGDAYSGYVADVRYEGEAQYPAEHAYAPKAYAPKPVYHPAPYHPAPYHA